VGELTNGNEANIRRAGGRTGDGVPVRSSLCAYQSRPLGFRLRAPQFAVDDGHQPLQSRFVACPPRQEEPRHIGSSG
jgi:hypothetical protein